MENPHTEFCETIYEICHSGFTVESVSWTFPFVHFYAKKMCIYWFIDTLLIHVI